jgi:hypothetical protein
MFSILDAFSNSSNKISVSSKSAQDLILIHQNLKPLNKSIFISQLSLIATAIADFATHQLSAVAHLSKAGFICNKMPLYVIKFQRPIYNKPLYIVIIRFMLSLSVCFKVIALSG